MYLFLAPIAGVIVGTSEGMRVLRSHLVFAVIAILVLGIIVFAGVFPYWDWDSVPLALYAGTIFYVIPCVATAAIVSLFRWVYSKQERRFPENRDL
ncbi:MAG: hypothetical protein ABSA69_11190 [Verrucomicrobiota bacterium]|jgi:biotin transporter BioY